MAGVGNAGALLFQSDFALEIGRHAGELSDHGLDLCSAATFLFDLKTPETDECIARLHHPETPNHRRGFDRLVNPTARPCDYG